MKRSVKEADKMGRKMQEDCEKMKEECGKMKEECRKMKSWVAA